MLFFIAGSDGGPFAVKQFFWVDFIHRDSLGGCVVVYIRAIAAVGYKRLDADCRVQIIRL